MAYSRRSDTCCDDQNKKPPPRGFFIPKPAGITFMLSHFYSFGWSSPVSSYSIVLSNSRAILSKISERRLRPVNYDELTLRSKASRLIFRILG
jgi:hypothetical protein